NPTQIIYMTEAILLQELLYDPLLSNYSIIILDEIHERNVNTDLLLGLLMKIMKIRLDLHLIICSATLNIQQFQVYFQQFFPAKQISSIAIEGQSYPVQIFHTIHPIKNYCKAAVETINYILTDFGRNNGGDILVFLTGKQEIE